MSDTKMIEVLRESTPYPYLCDSCDVVSTGQLLSIVECTFTVLALVAPLPGNIVLKVEHVIPEDFACSELCKECHEELGL